MMRKLMARGEALAGEAWRRQVGSVADRLREIFGNGSVDVEEGRVLVRGRGILKRWLADPALRFLSGGPK